MKLWLLTLHDVLQDDGASHCVALKPYNLDSDRVLTILILLLGVGVLPLRILANCIQDFANRHIGRGTGTQISDCFDFSIVREKSDEQKSKKSNSTNRKHLGFLA